LFVWFLSKAALPNNAQRPHLSFITRLNPEIMPQTQLWFHLPDGWIPLLSIPKEELPKFSTRPLKWLRYLGSTIYGREGILKEAQDGPEVEDYAIKDTGTLLADYYYQSTGE
jgi:hypothetical protein